MNENNQENQEGRNERANQSRSPFTKLDNKRKNLHSLDVDRDEIAPDTDGLSAEEMEKTEKHNADNERS